MRRWNLPQVNTKVIDVYKRQRYTVSAPLRSVQGKRPPDVLHPCAGCRQPVSYTHLDVYKRQVLLGLKKIAIKILLIINYMKYLQKLQKSSQ